MAAAVTLLPAVLGFVGHTIDKWSLPMAKHRKPVDQTFWARWRRTLQNRPWPAAICGLALLLLLAIPALGLRLGVADTGNDPTQASRPAARTTSSPRASVPASTVRCSLASKVTEPGQICGRATGCRTRSRRRRTSRR